MQVDSEPSASQSALQELVDVEMAHDSPRRQEVGDHTDSTPSLAELGASLPVPDPRQSTSSSAASTSSSGEPLGQDGIGHRVMNTNAVKKVQKARKNEGVNAAGTAAGKETVGVMVLHGEQGTDDEDKEVS